MKRLVLLVVCSLMNVGIFAQAKQIAQSAKAVYEYDNIHRVHIVSFDQAFEHDFHQQKAMYDIQFQMNSLKKLYMSINIAQNGTSSEVMRLVEMYNNPSTAYVAFALKNSESLANKKAVLKGEVLLTDTGDTLALLNIVLPMDSFITTNPALDGKSPDEMKNYIIGRFSVTDLATIQVAKKNFFMNYLYTSYLVKPALELMEEKTGVQLLPMETVADYSEKRVKSNEMITSSPYKKLAKKIEEYGRCRIASLSPVLGGALAFGTNGFYWMGHLPEDFKSYLKFVHSSLKRFEDINILDNGSYVIVYDYYEFFVNGGPVEMVNALSDISNADHVQSACFNMKGEWAVVSKHKFYASDAIMEHIIKAKKQYGKPKHCYFTENGISVICSRGIYTHNVPQKVLDALKLVKWTPSAIKFTDAGHFVITSESEKYIYNL